MHGDCHYTSKRLLEKHTHTHTHTRTHTELLILLYMSQQYQQLISINSNIRTTLQVVPLARQRNTI